MKIEVLKENLKTNLAVAERVVGKNLSLPILNNVLMATDDNYLNLVSTDLEVAIKLWILVKILNKGTVVVPAKFLSQFISSLPNEKITVEQKGQNVYIECGNVKTQIQGFNPEDFPLIPEFKDTQYIEVDSKKVHYALSLVADIASMHQSRPEISGIYFSFSKDSIKVVATDSFRLGEKHIHLDQPLKTPDGKDHSFILPQKSAREVLSMLENREGPVRIYFSPNQVLFELLFKEVDHPQIQITSRLIEGEYPNYQDIIPSSFKTNVIIKRDEFLNQIKTASLFSGKINEVRITVNKEKQEMEIFAQSPDIGEHNSSLPVKLEGDAVKLSFNYKYLLDGLSHIKSSEVVFDISKEDGPCILRPVGDSSY
ncbi:DNA polymerase III subunit beta, partial [Candidatus Parcubacteria bacterium]|nr:DNA polymerase III subunit beta [Candidatus Parcubacteria bacterium]